jgi:succinate dehydrogenase/fumarate reductase cytochrome b subunit
MFEFALHRLAVCFLAISFLVIAFVFAAIAPLRTRQAK